LIEDTSSAVQPDGVGAVRVRARNNPVRGSGFQHLGDETVTARAIPGAVVEPQEKPIAEIFEVVTGDDQELDRFRF
jgi:hypothetical protein